MSKANEPSPVSRAVYQKLAKENKRLKKDIIILTLEKYVHSFSRALMIKQWREIFKREEEFDILIKETISGSKKTDINFRNTMDAGEQQKSIEDLNEFNNHPQR